MKCDILCIKCYKRSLLASAIHTKDLYICEEDVEKAGGCFELPLPISEERKYVNGQARRDFRCDVCNKEISKDEECVARSLIGYRQKYVPWEERFIKVWGATVKVCPGCGEGFDENEFRDVISRKEYGISGLCQGCQDMVFSEEVKEE